MATCRIQSLKPPCAYNVFGIQAVQLLDLDDFVALRFDGDDLYSNCLVTAIYRTGEFIELETPDSARVTSTLQNGRYTHTIETFIGDLSAFYASNLHLATKRRFLACFRSNAGGLHLFGYEAGASLVYANQTDEATGSLVTITASSIYPLFEATPDAMTTTYTGEFIPDFETLAFCEIKP